MNRSGKVQMVGKDPPEEIIQLYTYLLPEDKMLVGFKFYLPLKTGIKVIKITSL